MAVKEKEVVKEVEVKDLLPEADVHHMIQKLGAAAMPDGTITVGQADEHLRVWLKRGYRLAFCQAMDREPHSINMMYVLIKDA